MTKELTVIKVSVRTAQDDWYIATSKDMPGLFMSDTSYDTLKSILPEAIQLLFKAQGKDVVVRPSKAANVDQMPSEVEYVAIAANIMQI